MTVIPVLMYHHISPRKGDMITVTPGDFEAHLRSIIEGGYRALSLRELLDFVSGSLPVRERALVITFDDAYLDNYVFAFPLLKKYGLRAVVFAPTALLDGASTSPIDKRGLERFKEAPPSHNDCKALVREGRYSHVAMNWDMASEMRESGLVEFGSHTKTHVECQGLGGEKLRDELQGSKTRLEERLGSPCTALCWPRGKFDEGAVEAAKKAGYRACFTTRRDVVTAGADPFSLGRIVTKGGAAWLGKRLSIYTSPLLSRLYIAMRGGKS